MLCLPKFRIGFLLVVYLFSFAIYANDLALWQSKDYIKKAFFEIAYKNEYSKGARKLKRWNKDVKYKIDYFKLPPSIEMVENLIDDHFKDLSSIIELSIVKSDKKANFTIVLTKREHYAEAIKLYINSKIKDLPTKSNCVLSIKHKRYELVKAITIIPVDHVMRYGLLPACVVEELTQAMGLPNDSDWVNPSIANDKSVSDLLTGLDYLMLKILYDKRLSVGMGIAQSSPIIDKILNEFEINNIIKNSVLKVRNLNLANQLDE